MNVEVEQFVQGGEGRNYGRTEWVSVGIEALGILGFFSDRVIRVAAGTFPRRCAVKV